MTQGAHLRHIGEVLAPDLFARMNLHGAVESELTSRNRLMPRRWDHLALAARAEDVERLLRPRLRRGDVGSPADVVYADKGWRGVRPLHVMALEDRVLYRTLVDLLAATLPERLRSRGPVAAFRQAALDVPGVRYVTKTDVVAYYEFVDHGLLADELIGQTGEEPAVVALVGLLSRIMSRRVGLPQIHTASDVLGDTYIDPVRRRLLRKGYTSFTYSDDFLIASTGLGAARAAIEACAAEVRALGLVLNERKTYTYGSDKYRRSVGAFAEAERRLFADEEHSPDDVFLLDEGYGDDEVADSQAEQSLALGRAPLDSEVDEDDATADEPAPGLLDGVSAPKERAARRAWHLWLDEDEAEEVQSGRTAAITQSLLGRALPILGAAGDDRPLTHLSELLRFEPALTPQVAAYLTAYAAGGPSTRSEVRSALDEAVRQDIVSIWQAMWLAHAAGGLRRTRRAPDHVEWLVEQVSDGPDGLAATAAAALGRLHHGDPGVLASALDRVGPEWRQLVLWGLKRLDPAAADRAAEHALDRVMLAAETP